jgi:hypothetical protein
MTRGQIPRGSGQIIDLLTKASIFMAFQTRLEATLFKLGPNWRLKESRHSPKVEVSV